MGSPEEAARGLLEIAHTAKRPADRIAAWRELLDRGYGKAPAFAAMEAEIRSSFPTSHARFKGLRTSFGQGEKPKPDAEATASSSG